MAPSVLTLVSAAACLAMGLFMWVGDWDGETSPVNVALSLGLALPGLGMIAGVFWRQNTVRWLTAFACMFAASGFLCLFVVLAVRSLDSSPGIIGAAALLCGPLVLGGVGLFWIIAVDRKAA